MNTLTDPPQRSSDPQPEVDPSLWARIRQWLRAQQGDESADAGNLVNDKLNQMLPDALSGRDAVLQQRMRQQAAYKASEG